MSAEGKNLEAIVKAVQSHNAKCAFPASAVKLNPFEVERLGWDEVLGLPIIPEPGVPTGRIVIVCGEGEPQEEAKAVDAVGRELVAA